MDIKFKKNEQPRETTIEVDENGHMKASDELAPIEKITLIVDPRPQKMWDELKRRLAKKINNNGTADPFNTKELSITFAAFEQVRHLMNTMEESQGNCCRDCSHWMEPPEIPDSNKVFSQGYCMERNINTYTTWNDFCFMGFERKKAKVEPVSDEDLEAAWKAMKKDQAKTGMNFYEAMVALNAGKKITRWESDRFYLIIDEGKKQKIRSISEHEARKPWNTQWYCQQADVLAEDWRIVK